MKAFDIETIPNQCMVENLPPLKVAYGNTKDPEKRAVLEAEAKKGQIEKMALNPFYGRVCAYSFYSPLSTESSALSRATDKDEIGLIEELLNCILVGQMTTNQIVTYNGMCFDFPYVYKRAIILKVKKPDQCPSLKYWTKRYSSAPHCDLMQELASWAYGAATNLDEAAGVILGVRKTERDYKEFEGLIDAGKGGEIRAACVADAKLTYDLWAAVEKYLF
jgi:predicted PolB exonuclease-like 3'-5' exonuclease